MSKKEIEEAAKKLEAYYAQFPDWYWKFGLHDAAILSVSELELAPNWEDKCPRRTCLEIGLDSSNAIYEKNIKKISLYNYKIKTATMNQDTDVDISKLANTWWMGDSLEQLSENVFLLGVECVDLHGNLLLVEIEFSSADVLKS